MFSKGNFSKKESFLISIKQKNVIENKTETNWIGWNELKKKSLLPHDINFLICLGKTEFPLLN